MSIRNFPFREVGVPRPKTGGVDVRGARAVLLIVAAALYELKIPVISLAVLLILNAMVN